MTKKRITFKDPKNLKMNCKSIRERQYFPRKSASTFEKEYPIAQARIVYKVLIFSLYFFTLSVIL